MLFVKEEEEEKAKVEESKGKGWKRDCIMMKPKMSKGGYLNYVFMRSHKSRLSEGGCVQGCTKRLFPGCVK